ncbi:MAG: hypothetical protein JSW17_02030, partial [Candidatus Omnitrophota bacterium]
RVLRKGGLLIFSAPHKSLFASIDPLDFKRRFPALYKMYLRISNYKPATPIEIGHKHVFLGEIEKLFANRFEIKDIRFCGFFMPLFSWILAVGKRCKILPVSIERRLNCLRGWESGVRYPRFIAFNIRLIAAKK